MTCPISSNKIRHSHIHDDGFRVFTGAVYNYRYPRKRYRSSQFLSTENRLSPEQQSQTVPTKPSAIKAGKIEPMPRYGRCATQPLPSFDLKLLRRNLMTPICILSWHYRKDSAKRSSIPFCLQFSGKFRDRHEHFVDSLRVAAFDLALKSLMFNGVRTIVLHVIAHNRPHYFPQ
jgi:hypothetical protein